MESRTLALAIVAALNAATGEIERLISEDGVGHADEDEAPPPSRSTKTRVAAGGKARKKAVDEDDGPTQDDVIAAVMAAQKVLDRPVIVKILKAKGKAGRATEVEPARRAAVIEAIEAAIEEAA